MCGLWSGAAQRAVGVAALKCIHGKWNARDGQKA